MGEKKTGKSKDKVSKASYYQRPGNMTLEQWQIALRRQIVAKEHFGIQEMDAKEYPGYYTVHNPVSRNDYRVVYRGEASEWNYCSCMDFKASRLGTCKHLEAVRLWLEKSGKKAFTGTPPYTSVYLSYRHGREVRLRIGTEHAGEFRALAEPYFTLKSPEATSRLVDELVEEDRTTGKTTLRIPVPDKECVADLLRLAGKLLSGLGGEK